MNPSSYLWPGVVLVVFLLLLFGRYLSERYAWFPFAFLRKSGHPTDHYHPFLRRVIPMHIHPHPQLHAFAAYQNIDRTKMKPMDQSILYHMEPFRTTGHFDLVISGRTYSGPETGNAVVYVPPWSFMMAELKKWSIPDLLKPRQVFPKKRFCAFMYSNCQEKSSGVEARMDFFERLNRRKRVHAVGKCKFNITPEEEKELSLPSRQSCNWDDTIEHLKHYKFVIAIENTLNLEGYVTEKLVFPLLAGCVPIYLGDPKTVESQFNPKSFIHVAQFPSVDACIEHVLQVDADPALYEAYVRTPFISKEKLWECAAWYYGGSSFYDGFFKAFPKLYRYAYVPLRNGYQSDPRKPIKVVNLDRSADRWENMQKQLDRFPFLMYERFPAVYGKLYLDEYRDHIDTRHMKTQLNAGELGIYLSTMEILHALTQDNQNDYYVLLEDDVTIQPSMQAIDSYVKDAPLDWDVLYLSIRSDMCTPSKEKEYIQLDSTCMPANHAVVFRKRAAQYYLNFAFPIVGPIDMFPQMCYTRLAYYMLNPKHSPILANIDESTSIITKEFGTRATLNWDASSRNSSDLIEFVRFRG